MIFQLFVLGLICFLYKKEQFKNLRFAFKSTSKAVGILMLLCVFIMEGVVTLISFETDNISVQNAKFLREGLLMRENKNDKNFNFKSMRA